MITTNQHIIMSTILAVFLHSFKSTFRNLKSSGIMFVLPIVFMGIFGIAFGGESNVNFDLGIVQGDTSALDVQEMFTEIVSDNNSLEMIVKSVDDEDELKDKIDNEELDIGVIVTTPEADPNSFSYEIVVPDGDVGSFVNRAVVTDLLTSIRFGEDASIPVNVVDPDQDNLTGFDYLAPGLIVYGLIILIPGVANDFTNIAEKNQIFRYANSKVKAYEIIAGNTLFYIFLGIIQTILLYFTARVLGYNAIGNVVYALVPALLVLLFVVAVGLLVGSFFDKTEVATNVGTILSIIMGFFSGSFIQGVGNLLEFDLFGRTFQFNEFLPTTWGTKAFQKILTQGDALTDIQTELWVLLISGIITLIISTWVYSSHQLNFQK